MKTAASQLFLASLALGHVLPKGGRHRNTIGEDDFIKVNGLRLYDSQDKLHYLTGTICYSGSKLLLTTSRHELLGLYEFGCR